MPRNNQAHGEYYQKTKVTLYENQYWTHIFIWFGMGLAGGIAITLSLI